MTNQHMDNSVNQKHCIVTLYFVAFAITYFPQEGHAVKIVCGHEKCDPSYQWCNYGECAHCADICLEHLKLCKKECLEYYNNHFNTSTTQEPIAEKGTSLVTDVQENGDEKTTLQPVSEKPVLTIVITVVVVLILLILIVGGIILIIYRRLKKKSQQRNGDEGQVSNTS